MSFFLLDVDTPYQLCNSTQLMKIATKTGDNGTTGLLYGARMQKTHQVFEVMGDLDEASAMIGMAKAKMEPIFDEYRPIVLDTIQKDIIAIMGELNCLSLTDVEDYIKTFDALGDEALLRIDHIVESLQCRSELIPRGWVLYGESELSARFDMASKIVRRAERSYNSYIQTLSFTPREVIGKYINRLSDCLYLFARLADFYFVSSIK